jgi:hypothetical protein
VVDFFPPNKLTLTEMQTFISTAYSSFFIWPLPHILPHLPTQPIYRLPYPGPPLPDPVAAVNEEEDDEEEEEEEEAIAPSFSS